MKNSRSEYIDILRGVIILDMILVHNSSLFSGDAGLFYSKIIGYTDIAIEGFLVLFGMMIGGHYYKNYLKNSKIAILRILKRALYFIALHYGMVLTIGILFFYNHYGVGAAGKSIGRYLFESLFFLNQMPLLHILPTFIPLLFLTLLVFPILKKNFDQLLIILSFVFFILGTIDPYIFNIGDKTIFPIILWQVYFVIGVILGKYFIFDKKQPKRSISFHLFFASTCVAIFSILYFGHHFSEWIGSLKFFYGIKITKFPLNTFGFLYRSSILYLVACLTFMVYKYSPSPKNSIGRFFKLFGRNALDVFIIHIYFNAITLILQADFAQWKHFIIWIGFLSNIIFTTALIRYREYQNK
ncbi:MAG: succinyl transferase OpgC [Desulfobacteraceae bacterium]|nr:succinyl transferase OpgC [Desulfobacteraceae bacterium]MBC2749203.1 OpgC domain-containing protein [Desulfobacteraceae bacterium]